MITWAIPVVAQSRLSTLAVIPSPVLLMDAFSSHASRLAKLPLSLDRKVGRFFLQR
jgi:hypothetical protein